MQLYSVNVLKLLVEKFGLQEKSLHHRMLIRYRSLTELVLSYGVTFAISATNKFLCLSS